MESEREIELNKIIKKIKPKNTMFVDTPAALVEIPPTSSYFYGHKNYPIIRIGKIRLFNKYLCRHKTFAKLENKKQHSIVKDLERSCFRLTIQKSKDNGIVTTWTNEEFDDKYHHECGRVLSYLNHKETDSKLVDTNINNLINVAGYAVSFPTLTHKDFYPELYKKIDKHQNAGDQKKVKYSKLYYCRMCKRSLSTVANRYNRSLDEAINLTITCVYCGFERLCSG